MNIKAKKINKIMSEFLQNESMSTDMRIIAIRRFLAVLSEAVDKYFDSNEQISSTERDYLSNMIDDMAEIYREEISSLLLKRGKLTEYISILSAENKEAAASTKNPKNADDELYIN